MLAIIGARAKRPAEHPQFFLAQTALPMFASDLSSPRCRVPVDHLQPKRMAKHAPQRADRSARHAWPTCRVSTPPLSPLGGLSLHDRSLHALHVAKGKPADSAGADEGLYVRFDPALIRVKRRGLDGSAPSAKEASRASFFQIPIAYLCDRHPFACRVPRGGWVFAPCDCGQLLAREVPRLLWRQYAMLAKNKPPRPSFRVTILHEIGLHAGGLQPQSEAPQFSVPGEDIALRLRSQAINNALCDLRHRGQFLPRLGVRSLRCFPGPAIAGRGSTGEAGGSELRVGPGISLRVCSNKKAMQ